MLSNKKAVIWIAVLVVLICIAVAVIYFTTPRFEDRTESADISVEASYESLVSNSVEESVQSEAESAESNELLSLKERFPQYFGLDTANGLTVYVWQMAKGSYSCGLLSGKAEAHTNDNVLALKPCTVPVMRKIMLYYRENGGESVQFAIQPVNHPLSSYYYTIDEAYTHSVCNLLHFDWYNEYKDLFKTALFDVDGDGEKELCTITSNPYTGMSYDYFVAFDKNGCIKYSTTYANIGCALEFSHKADGTACVKATQYMAPQAVYYLDVCVENGNIVLKSEELTIAPWDSSQKKTYI